MVVMIKFVLVEDKPWHMCCLSTQNIIVYAMAILARVCVCVCTCVCVYLSRG